MAEHKEIEVDLLDDGVLWYLNRAAFHPRGLALAYDKEKGTFLLWGDMDEPWSFAVEEDDKKFKAFEATLERLMA